MLAFEIISTLFLLNWRLFKLIDIENQGDLRNNVMIMMLNVTACL